MCEWVVCVRCACVWLWWLCVVCVCVRCFVVSLSRCLVVWCVLCCVCVSDCERASSMKFDLSVGHGFQTNECTDVDECTWVVGRSRSIVD